jgi:hypothetical protein
MSDRSAARIFSEIFKLLAVGVPNTRVAARHFWNLSQGYDFSHEQMVCNTVLIQLGLAKQTDEGVVYLGEEEFGDDPVVETEAPVKRTFSWQKDKYGNSRYVDDATGEIVSTVSKYLDDVKKVAHSAAEKVDNTYFVNDEKARAAVEKYWAEKP